MIDRANLTRFSETRSLSDQTCMLKNFRFLKVTEVIDVKGKLAHAQIEKFQICSDSEFASVCEQKRTPNPHGYRDIFLMIAEM